MNVIKRNGEIELFNKDKIYNAIEKAYVEVHGGFFEDDYHNMQELCDEVEESVNGEKIDIEEIQDLVEELLMEIDKQVAKAYILYREKRNTRRDSIKQVYYRSEFLSEEFLSQYPDYPEHMSPVSQFTFLRTYSRDIPELLRRETWKETCIRSIHHNISMDDRDRTPDVMEFLTKEAETMFDIQFNLRGFLSGRALFTGGSKAAEKYPLSLFNCSFIEPTKLEDFGDMLYLLSVGAGVGYRITWDVVDKLPLFKSRAKLIAMDYLQIPKNMRQEDTKVYSYGTSKMIVVGDSKEGWQQSVVEFLSLMQDETVEEIKINYSNIRPEGEALKTFGGYASGHYPLQKMFEGIHEVLTSDYKDSQGNILTSKMVDGKLRPVHVMHISNMIASAIVVGGVRRSAMIALFSRDDEEMKNAKRNFADYSDPKISHYWLSNNTMIFEEGYTPSKDEIKDAVEALKNYGEPGFMNESELKRRHSEARGANPCFEILLRSYQTCNLITQSVSAYVDDNGFFDSSKLLNELEVLTRSGYRVTLNKLEIPHWDETQKEDRLLGISPTSWMDFIEKTGFDNDEEENILAKMREKVHSSANEYADALGLNHSVNYTAVKPSGTLGLLANGGSPGVHMSHAPYYWRTIRVSKNNPIYDVLLKTNWRIEDDVTKPDSTAVVYFPQVSPVERTKFDTTVEEQLERYKRFQRNYTDQNTSITVDVKNGEWDNVVEWLDNNWDEFTGLSFLSLTDHQYQQAPYITSTKKEIEEAIKNMSNLDHDFVAKYMNLDHKYKEEIIEDPACSSGACGLDRI